MATGDSKTERVADEAKRLERRFGPFAEVYADARGEAAEIVGDEADEEHWKRLAADLEEGGR